MQGRRIVMYRRLYIPIISLLEDSQTLKLKEDSRSYSEVCTSINPEIRCSYF